MADWKQTFDAVFFVSIATLICGIIGLIIKICLKMKCETVSLCCGMITVQRRVDLEVEEEITALELGSSSTQTHDLENPQGRPPGKESLPQTPTQLSPVVRRSSRLASRSASDGKKPPLPRYLKHYPPEEEESLKPLKNPPVHSESTPS